MTDHRELERLFGMLENQPDSRPLVVPVVAALLTAHSRAEESVVYPAAREEAGETDQVEHSQEEHLEAEKLLHELADTDPNSAQFETKLRKFVEAVSHHVQEEESSVLPGMRSQLSDDRRRELGEAFAAARANHLLAGDSTSPSAEELRQQASNLDLPGRSQMSKEQLERQLQK